MMEKNAKIYVAGHRGMVGSAIVRELQRQGLTGGNWEYLEPHALAVTETIRDGELRNLHLMEG